MGLAALSANQLALNLGNTKVLRGIDLRVDSGDVYGLLGRNGAGKTTTLRTLLGLIPQFSGVGEVFGVSSRRLHLLETPIGVALDPPGLDDTLSVAQNLKLAALRGGIQGGRSVSEVLSMVGLTHRAHHRGNRLSHGQGRRAAVARALLGAPQLLVLDEPLSGLDPEGVEELLELFRGLALEHGVTVVLSSHHLREVQDVCNRVGLIEKGRVILEGETRRLLSDSGSQLEIHCSDASRAATVLETVEGVTGVRMLGHGRVGAQIAEEVNKAHLCTQLVSAQVGLDAFVPKQSSLVDVFMNAVEQSEAVA